LWWAETLKAACASHFDEAEDDAFGVVRLEEGWMISKQCIFHFWHIPVYWNVRDSIFITKSLVKRDDP